MPGRDVLMVQMLSQILDKVEMDLVKLGWQRILLCHFTRIEYSVDGERKIMY
jgi:hypothetical protein